MPAMDIVNLAVNENNPKKDFSLAFIGAFFETWLNMGL